MNEKIYKSLLEAVYFSPKSIQFPLSWVGHIPFAAWIVKEYKPKVIVELGTHSGNSYFSLCQSVSENGIAAKTYAVDTWQGDEHAGYYDGTIFDYVNSHNDKNYATFSSLLRMTFDEAAGYFSDKTIDLLHIDGLHTYDAVKHDFETWLPKLSPGAFVLFHDINVRERGFGVWKFWEEITKEYKSLTFLHSHGLGVLRLPEIDQINQDLELFSGHIEDSLITGYFSKIGSVLQCRYEVDGYKQELSVQIQELINQSKLINQLQEDAENKELLIEKLKDDSDKKASLIEAILFSKSWKITAPIRYISSIFK